MSDSRDALAAALVPAGVLRAGASDIHRVRAGAAGAIRAVAAGAVATAGATAAATAAATTRGGSGRVQHLGADFSRRSHDGGGCQSSKNRQKASHLQV